MALKTKYYNCPKCKCYQAVKHWESVGTQDGEGNLRIWEWECYRCDYRKWKWIFMLDGQSHSDAYEC